MTRIELPLTWVHQIYAHALKEYPRECCGIGTGLSHEKSSWTHLYPCQNVIDEYHTHSPKEFLRNSQNGFLIDPKQLLRIYQEMRSRGEEIKLFYHSHVDADAYLSDEDRKWALHQGEPVYPNALQCVVSVMRGEIRSCKFFAWDSGNSDYTMIADFKETE